MDTSGSRCAHYVMCHMHSKTVATEGGFQHGFPEKNEIDDAKYTYAQVRRVWNSLRYHPKVRFLLLKSC